MLDRVVVPDRLALICRDEESVAYNPNLNLWERVDRDTAEALRWLRAGRPRSELASHLARRFASDPGVAEERLAAIVKWCVLRRILYLDQQLNVSASGPDATLSTVYWICTQACNLRCTYCYQEAAVARRDELTTAEGFQLIDHAVAAGADTFIFTGGEPFSRKDLLQLARYSRGRGLRTNVITNGHFVTEKTAKDVAEAFHTITISLDHDIPEHHDRARGDGSWARAVRAIELLLGLGADVDVNTVLSRYGLSDLQALLRFGRDHDLGQHKVVPQFPMGRGGGSREDELEPDELLALNDRMQQAERDLGPHEKRAGVEGESSGKRQLRKHCGAGLSEVSVDPEG